MGTFDVPTEDPHYRESISPDEALWERIDKQLTKAYRQNGELLFEMDRLRAERDQLQLKLDKARKISRAVESLLDALDMPEKFPEDEEDEVLDDAEGF